MPPTVPECPECDQPLTDVNEGRAGLRFGPPCFECTNPDCPRCPAQEAEDE